MERNRAENKKQKPSRKRMIWLIVAGVALVLLIVGGIEAYRILYQPQNLFAQQTFDPSLMATTQAETQPPTLEPEDSETPDAATSAPTASPTEAPTPTPDITQTKDILNILLIGVDRRRGEKGNEKGTPDYAGTDPHADVQMVIAINFKEKRVDLISLPRDTFIYNPDLMDGVYKLNATFNVGGGFDAKDGAGFRNVCKGAEYMLGGIPVDYYYAVDFNAVVNLVDAIGGVDFNVDSSLHSLQHKKGMQHMSGIDVLYFLRIRKVGPEAGDQGRINRQKDMMVAIFNQLKSKKQLSLVPKLIGAANSGVFTNTNMEQTLALANYAINIDPKKIGMYSIGGPSSDSLGWRWCFTDQKNRQEVIKKVYGVDVPEQTRYSLGFAQWLRQYGFNGMVYLKTAKQLMDTADKQRADFTAEQQKAYDNLSAAYEDTKKAWDSASLTTKSKETRAMLNAMNKMKKSADAFVKLMGYKDKLKWSFDNSGTDWVNEPKINPVKVDFK